MSQQLQCLLREVARGDFQYVPLAEVAPSLRVNGEKVFTGQFATQQENHGPSGSHTRTICLPRGPLTTSFYKG